MFVYKINVFFIFKIVLEEVSDRHKTQCVVGLMGREEKKVRRMIQKKKS